MTNVLKQPQLLYLLSSNQPLPNCFKYENSLPPLFGREFGGEKASAQTTSNSCSNSSNQSDFDDMISSASNSVGACTNINECFCATILTSFYSTSTNFLLPPLCVCLFSFSRMVFHSFYFLLPVFTQHSQFFQVFAFQPILPP